MGQRICLYPGSFDPVTNGHMSVIRRAACLFDRVCVAILGNPEKPKGLRPELRAELLKTACEELPNVTVITAEGLTCELARKLNASWLIRGLRGHCDLDSELTMARVNHMLNGQLETVFLGPEPGLEDVSSSLVRELTGLGADITAFVPMAVHKRILSLYGPNQSGGTDNGRKQNPDL